MARRFDTIISWLGRVMVMVMIARTELSWGTRLWGPSYPARSGHLALAWGTLAPTLVTRGGCLADSCHPWPLQHSRVPWNILRMVMVNSE